MDGVYEGDNMRAMDMKKKRIDPWEYDAALYRRRNEVERFFKRIKLICD